MPQESCRPWAWLIFDVRQSMLPLAEIVSQEQADAIGRLVIIVWAAGAVGSAFGVVAVALALKRAKGGKMYACTIIALVAGLFLLNFEFASHLTFGGVARWMPIATSLAALSIRGFLSRIQNA